MPSTLVIAADKASWGNGHSKDFQYLGLGKRWVLDSSNIDVPENPDRAAIQHLVEQHRAVVERFISNAAKQRGLDDTFLADNAARIAEEVFISISD